MSERDSISAPDLERLSAYLDGQLAPAEVARLEARLQRDSQLEQALEQLRGTLQALRSLPQADPPRDFRLTEQMLGAPGLLGQLRRLAGSLRAPKLYPVLQLSTALAALALVVVLGADALFNRSMAGVSLQAQTAPSAASESIGQVADELEQSEQPSLQAAASEDQELTAAAPAAAEDRAAAPQLFAAGAAPTGTPLAAEEAAAPAPTGTLAAGAGAEAGAASAGTPATSPPTNELEAARTSSAEPTAVAAPSMAQPQATAAVEQYRAAAEQPGQPESAGLAALTVVEIGLAAATLLLLALTILVSRRG